MHCIVWLCRSYYPLQQKKLPCIEGTAATTVLQGAEEISGELVLTKTAFDGFHDPKLQLYETLKKLGKKCLLFCGIRTSVCVLLTMASAYQLGYLTVLVDGCVGDHPQKHQFVIKEYNDVCFECVQLEEVLGCKHFEKWK